MSEKIVVLSGGQGEIVEKKSRFIATIIPVSSEEEATAFIEESKKKYWDAKHNCSAYVIGDNNEISRCSDDKEPSGTAGRPMLEVLLGEGLHNVCVVVTRYFGGVLLGTGGLVRAYQDAVKEGLKNCETGVKCKGKVLQLNMSYNDIGKMQNLLSTKDDIVDETNYLENVTMKITVSVNEVETRIKEITEISCGKIVIEDLGERDYIQRRWF